MPEVIKCSFTLPFAYCTRALGASSLSCVQAEGCAGDSTRHHSCGPRSSRSRSTRTFHVTQSPHPGRLWHLLDVDLWTVYFLSGVYSMLCKPITLLGVLDLFQVDAWLWGQPISPHSRSAEPTHLPLLDSNKSTL